jgi:hypothetical protein
MKNYTTLLNGAIRVMIEQETVHLIASGPTPSGEHCCPDELPEAVALELADTLVKFVGLVRSNKQIDGGLLGNSIELHGGTVRVWIDKGHIFLRVIDPITTPGDPVSLTLEEATVLAETLVKFVKVINEV